MSTVRPTPDNLSALPDAAATDPIALGWMQGTPPAPDKLVRFADGTSYRFPQFRWSFCNQRQLLPTRNVARGIEDPSPLPRHDLYGLDAITFTPIGSTQTMTWGESIAANYTDGIVVLHRGRIVYERYLGALKPDGHHIGHSVSKSFVGLLGAILVNEGSLDENALIPHYVPELRDTAFGDATVRQLLDMTTGLRYSENYADPQAEIYEHVRAGGVLPRPPGYQGPEGFCAFLQTLKKEGEHGAHFMYKTVNTDALAWVIARACGQSVSGLLSERIWSKLGMAQDAYFTVDALGTEFAGGGLNTNLRDLARFGEMMRQDGTATGQQIVPSAVIADIRRGSSTESFAKAGYALLKGWSYRNMWWITHNPHSAYCARGVHGQTVYIDPTADMVIARYASFPLAANWHNDPTSLPAYHAMARRLMES